MLETIRYRRGLSLGCPCPFDVGDQQKATFIEKNQVCAETLRFAANLWPDIALPMSDGGFISLHRTAFRLLTTPAETAQDLPDMSEVIGDVKMLLDQFGDAA